MKHFTIGVVFVVTAVALFAQEAPKRPEGLAPARETARSGGPSSILQALSDPALRQALQHAEEQFRALQSSPEFIRGTQRAEAELASIESSPELARRKIEFLQKLGLLQRELPPSWLKPEPGQPPSPASSSRK